MRESDWSVVTTDDFTTRPRAGAAPGVAANLGTGARGLSTKTESDQGIASMNSKPSVPILKTAENIRQKPSK